MTLKKTIEEWTKQKNIVISRGKTFQNKLYIVGKDTLGQLQFLPIP